MTREEAERFLENLNSDIKVIAIYKDGVKSRILNAETMQNILDLISLEFINSFEIPNRFMVEKFHIEISLNEFKKYDYKISKAYESGLYNEVCDDSYKFDNFEEAMEFFKKQTSGICTFSNKGMRFVDLYQCRLTEETYNFDIDEFEYFQSVEFSEDIEYTLD